MVNITDYIKTIKELNTVYTNVKSSADALAGSVKKLQTTLDKSDKSVNSIASSLKKLSTPVKIHIDTSTIASANTQTNQLHNSLNNLPTVGSATTESSGGMSDFKSELNWQKIAANGVKKIAEMAAKTIGESIVAAMEFSKTLKTFEILSDNAEKGRTLVNELKELERTTILGHDIYKDATILLDRGIAESEIVKDLRMLGDVAMGDSDKLQTLAIAYGHVRDTGLLQAEDIEKFGEAHFNLLKVMADNWEAFGFKEQKTITQLRKMGEEGVLSADMVTKALQIATNEGGQFYNAMEKITETSGGQMMKLKSNWEIFKVGLGELFLPLADDLVSVSNEILGFANKSKPMSQILTDEMTEINDLITSITNLTKENKLRGIMLEQLKEKYPDTFANLDLENIKNGELLSILQDINAAYKLRVSLNNYDLQSKEPDAEIKKLTDLSVKAALELQNRKKSNSFPHESKYLTNSENLSIKSYLPYSSQYNKDNEINLDKFLVFSESRIADLKYSKKLNQDQFEATKMIIEGKNLLKSPAEMFKRWGGNNMYKNQMLLINEIDKWSEAVNPMNFFKHSDIFKKGSFDIFQNLLRPAQDPPTTKDSNNPIIQHDAAKSDEVTSSGFRSIVFNIDTLGVKGGMTVNAQTINEGISNIHDIIVSELNRALDSVGGVVAN